MDIMKKIEEHYFAYLNKVRIAYSFDIIINHFLCLYCMLRYI